MARSYALLPGDRDDYSLALGQAVAQVTQQPGQAATHYILGLICERMGRHEEAIHHLEDSMRGDPRWPTYMNWPVLAMAHHRLGHRDEARRWLERCHSPRDGGPSDDTHTLGPHWWDYAEFALLRREADTLVLDGAFPADPFAP